MRKQTENTFVLSDASEILEALVGLKDVRVLHYQHRGPEVALVIEQLAKDARCRACISPAQVKDRRLVTYLDLPIYGAPMVSFGRNTVCAVCMRTVLCAVGC